MGHERFTVENSTLNFLNSTVNYLRTEYLITEMLVVFHIILESNPISRKEIETCVPLCNVLVITFRIINTRT